MTNLKRCIFVTFCIRNNKHGESTTMAFIYINPLINAFYLHKPMNHTIDI